MDLRLISYFFTLPIMIIVFSLNTDCAPIRNAVSNCGINWYECTIINEKFCEFLENVTSRECDSAIYYLIVFSYDSIKPSIDVYKICKDNTAPIDESVSLVGTNEYAYYGNAQRLFLIQTEYAYNPQKLKKYKDLFVQRDSITQSPIELNNMSFHRKRIHVAKYSNSK